MKIRAHEVFGTNYNENIFMSFFFNFLFEIFISLFYIFYKDANDTYLPVVLVKTLFLNYLLLILEPLYEIHF